MLRKRVCVSVVALAIGVAAADHQAQAQTAPAWSGFYAGVTAGYAYANDAGHLDPSFIFGGVPRSSSILGSKGASAGGLAGYNWLLTRRWLAGVEADASWQGIEISASSHVNSSSAELKQRWAVSLRGRLGYLVTPGTLVYGTTGWAWSGVKGSIDQFGAGAVSATATLNGVQAGVGAETVLTGNWRGRLEYLHTNYVNGDLPNSVNTGLREVHPSVGLVRVGAIYKFGPANEAAAWTEPRASVASWSGYYLGGSLGGAVGYGDVDVPGTGKVNGVGLAGPMLTVFGGYNWLLSPRWLIGAEAEIGPSVRSTDLELGWFASARARAGYLLMLDTLVYGSLGWTATQIDDIVVSHAHVASAQTINGLQLGGGIESALNNRWRVRIDYQHAFMEKVDVTVPAATPANTTTTPRGHVGRIALVRYFGAD